MPRPANVQSVMGFGLVRVGPAKMSRPHRTDPDPIGLAKFANFGGVLLEAARGVRPARSMFPPGPEGDAAFAAHLDELGERIKAGMRNAVPDREKLPPKKKAKSALHQKAAIFRGGKRISWLDLKTLKCAGCRRTLLGPSDECVRADAKARSHGFGTRAVKQLPPPVAGHVNERPVCAACHAAHQ